MLQSNTPADAFAGCTHERGPGTTVCLRCRHEQRAAAREKFNQLMLRVGAVGVVVLMFIAAGAFGASTIREKLANRTDQNSSTGVVATAHAEPVSETPIDSVSSSGGDVNPTVTHAPQPAQPSVTPILPVGESVLAEGVTAIRADGEVTVSFDSPMVRTRRPEKFEAFLRSTLPMVYGTPVRVALGSVPEGTMVASQDELLTELPTRGVRIPLDSTWAVRVYPETRPGQDGPLVIRYRTRLTTARE